MKLNRKWRSSQKNLLISKTPISGQEMGWKRRTKSERNLKPYINLKSEDFILRQMKIVNKMLQVYKKEITSAILRKSMGRVENGKRSDRDLLEQQVADKASFSILIGNSKEYIIQNTALKSIIRSKLF